MRWLFILPLALACSSGLPKPGSPDAAYYCESLRLTAESARQVTDELARTSFLLQVREYAEQLECPGDIVTNADLGE